jgi:hypothetical protein
MKQFVNEDLKNVHNIRNRNVRDIEEESKKVWEPKDREH